MTEHGLSAEFPDRWCCTCGFGATGAKRTIRGLRLHIRKAKSAQ